MSTPVSPYPSVGQPAPAFTALVVGGNKESVSLAELKGQLVVLYFYPKDDTPGCTKQACALRDNWSDIRDKAAVFGISGDSVASHEKFIRKFDLPFPLISDPDRVIANAYGVWVEKSMYGKKYMGIERSTFVIDADGRLKAVLPKVKPDEHLKKVLALL